MNGIGRLIDYAPTILELAGVPHDLMDGESMLSLFDTAAFPDRERHAESGIEASGACLSMVDPDGFKLIAMRQEPLPAEQAHLQPPNHHRLAVFDLKADPYEYHNIIDTPRGQDVLAWAVARHAELKAPV
jgi:arylsulfatase A-like enzyme